MTQKPDPKALEAAAEKLAECEKKCAECEEKYLRAAADLQNVRRRADEERATMPRLGKIALFEALLPIIDHANLAVKSAPNDPNEWEKGAIAILDSISSILKSAGFEEISESGGAIDPTIHEVLASENDGKVVAEVLQTGWRLGERVIRAAKVRAQ